MIFFQIRYFDLYNKKLVDVNFSISAMVSWWIMPSHWTDPAFWLFRVSPFYNQQINAIQPKMKRLNRTVIRFNLSIVYMIKIQSNIFFDVICRRCVEKLVKSFSDYKFVLTIFKSIYHSHVHVVKYINFVCMVCVE